MQQTELKLSKNDRAIVESVRSKGVHHSREVNRAHILASLDDGIAESQILAVLGVGRATLWRIRGAYLQGGLELALFDMKRSGRPHRYDTDVQAQVTALACSQPPKGRKRWTMLELERSMRSQPGLAHLSRETVRRMLKKTASNPGVV